MTNQLIDFFVIYGLGALLLLLLAAGIILGVTAAGVVAFLYRRITKPKGRHWD
jgi:nitrate reductase gamma subunit